MIVELTWDVTGPQERVQKALEEVALLEDKSDISAVDLAGKRYRGEDDIKAHFIRGRRGDFTAWWRTFSCCSISFKSHFYYERYMVVISSKHNAQFGLVMES
mmetsp:Transcript_11536/g.33990  ORF Transcript_11536/g.33990 Transcript_11536/m.33990 type:complete len:102 (+) Transcript_11536:1320-1625(+)